MNSLEADKILSVPHSPFDERVLGLGEFILDVLPIGILVCDRAGIIVRQNRTAAELWGRELTSGDTVEQLCANCRSSNGGGALHDVVADVLAGNTPSANNAMICKRTDGGSVSLMLTVRALKDSFGSVVGSIVCLQDTDNLNQNLAIVPEIELSSFDSRETAEKLRQRLASIVEFSEDAIVTKDLNGVVTNWSRGAEKLFGYSAEEAIGKSIVMIIPEDRLDEEPEILSRIRRGERIDQYETIRRRKDGSLVEISLTVSPIRDSSGRIVGASKIARDISERRGAEAIRQRLAAVVECSQDAILTKDLNGVITSWNQGAESLFGYTAHEAVGNPVTMLIPADHLDEEPEILSRIRRGEKIDHYETIRRRKDGTLMNISLTVSPLKDAKGRVIGASKIARDITERRRAEEHKQLLLREMNHRVKNLFALAGGVVTLSARTAETPADLAAAVRERLAALARAHDLTLADLSLGEPSAEKTTNLHDLVATIVSPFEEASAGAGRVAIRGPKVAIGSGAVTGLALLLHEFATNAVKYGALSVPAGQVEVDWSTEENALLLKWCERGGPPVEAPADDSAGFGTMLARRVVSGQLGGSIRHAWNRDGLTIELSLPLAILSA